MRKIVKGALVLLGLCLTAAGQTQGREFGPARAPLALASPGKMADDRTRYAQQSEGEKNPKRCREECKTRARLCRVAMRAAFREIHFGTNESGETRARDMKEAYRKYEIAKARCVTDSQSCEGRC
jgi:hypothetical protein